MTDIPTEQQHKEWLAALPKKSIAVKVIIKSPRGTILLVKATYKKAWQFPGGGVDPFEEPKEAAVRELKEELDFEIKQHDLRIVGTAFRKECDNLLLIYEYAPKVNEGTTFILQEAEIEGFKFEQPKAVPSQISDYYADFWQGYLDS